MELFLPLIIFPAGLLCTIGKLGAAADMNGFAWRACRRAYFQAYADCTNVFTLTDTFIELSVTVDVCII